jgi:hypothetical protein
MADPMANDRGVGGQRLVPPSVGQASCRVDWWCGVFRLDGVVFELGAGFFVLLIDKLLLIDWALAVFSSFFDKRCARNLANWWYSFCELLRGRKDPTSFSSVGPCTQTFSFSFLFHTRLLYMKCFFLFTPVLL